MAAPDNIYNTFVYDPDWVDAYYQKQRAQGKLHFAIMLGNAVIGDV